MHDSNNSSSTSQLHVSFTDILALLAFGNGLVLLALQPAVGTGMLLLSLILIAASKRGLIERRQADKKLMPPSYLAWLAEKLELIARIYVNRIDADSYSADAYVAYQQSSMFSALQLKPVEFVVVQLLAISIQTDPLSLLSKAIASDACKSSI